MAGQWSVGPEFEGTLEVITGPMCLFVSVPRWN